MDVLRFRELCSYRDLYFEPDMFIAMKHMQYSCEKMHLNKKERKG